MGTDMEYGNTGYRYGMRYIDMVINHIDTGILDIDMGYIVTLGGPLRTSAPDRGR